MTHLKLVTIAAVVTVAVVGAVWVGVSSLPVDADPAAVRVTAEGAVRTLYADPQPPAGYAGAGLSQSDDQALRDRVAADLRRYFARDLVARYQPMLSDAVDRIAAGSWDDGVSISLDWGAARISDGQAAISFVEHRSLTRHDVVASPSAWSLEGAWAWNVSLVKDDDQWRVASFDVQCQAQCP